MKGGDISNETPPRIIVNVDVVCSSEMMETKTFFKGTTKTRKVTGIYNSVLSKLWMLGNKHGLSVELAGIATEDWTSEHLQKLMDRLDNRGGNPFNYSELYDDLEHLISELPYRANLKGVIDIRERVARYGSWGIELNNL
jgi:hypothetical protein